MGEINPRRKGTNPLKETRRESNEKVKKNNHYFHIIEILNDFNIPLSAKEIAIEMKKRGYSKSDERNVASPRITEMLQDGFLEIVGTKKCQYTNVEVGVFIVRNIKE